MDMLLETLLRIENGETTLTPTTQQDMVRFQVAVVCLQYAHKQGLIKQPWFITSTSREHPWQIEKVSMLKLTALGHRFLKIQTLQAESAASPRI
ncbi:hypothetical protein ACKF11_08790 [Methylobacillus sp. Pita2]|uniref:hypothetical protein n=1 Tax=Methylobacillus sp. Pita2 TaxID=3383245 RepID=UPI0038B4B898